MARLFRLCASAVVFNDEGLLLLGNRIDTKEPAWQFPQGGIEEGETPLMAAKRELFEETSVVSVVPVYCDENANRYTFSEDVKQNFQKKGIISEGQDIYFSLFYFTGEEDEINVKTAHPEFREYCWKDFDFAVENIIDFKKEVYASAMHRLKPIIKQYLDNRS